MSAVLCWMTAPQAELNSANAPPASPCQWGETHPSMKIPINPAAIAGANAILMRPSTRCAVI